MSRQEWLNVYRPSFTRHLASLARSNFFVRDLGPDDMAMIEHIREHGALPSSTFSYDYVNRPVLLEELDYWQHGWEQERGVQRRRLQATVLTSEQIERRRKELEELRADRDLRKAELEREQRAWEWDRRRAREDNEKERRINAQLRADIEWEMAAGASREQAEEHARTSAEKLRNGIAYWEAQEQKAKQLNDDGRGQYATEQKLKARMSLLQCCTQRERAKLEAQWRDEEENERKERNRKALAKAREIVEAHKRETEKREAELAATERTDKAAFIGHTVIPQGLGFERKYFWDEVLANPAHLERQVIKGRILSTIRGTGTRLWSLRQLMQATQCDEERVVYTLAMELARDGYCYPGPLR
jgi:hypothetical protein